MKRTIIPIVLLTALLLFLASCSEPEINMGTEVQIEDEVPGKGGTINIGCIEPLNFNPLLVNSKTYQDVSKLIFNGLVEYDSNLKPVLVLADEISFTEGKGKATVKLKENLHWSDGVRVTSADVKYTLDTIKNSIDSIYKSKLDRIISYKIINDVTLTVDFGNTPYSAMDTLNIPIVPKHVFEANPSALPVGTGPFKVTSYSKLKYMELEPNEYGIKKQEPLISKVRINFIKDMDSFDSAFQTGQIDMINATSYDWQKYRELRDVDTFKYTSGDFEYMILNFQNPVLTSIEVRKALMYGINRKEIIDKYLLGNGSICDTPIRNDSWLNDGEALSYSYNKAEAQYAISSAGFSINEASKVFERDADGKKQQLRLTLITNTENDYRRNAAEDIKRSLEDIGFVIDLKIMPFEEVKKEVEGKNFDLALVGMNFSPDGDLFSFLHSSQANGGKNYGGYVNPRVDLLLEQTQNGANQDNKYVNYLELQRIIKGELPIISLFYKDYALTMRNKVKGDIEVDSENLFRTINNWYITESLR